MFFQRLNMHGLMYNKLIGNEGSSAMTKLLVAKLYGFEFHI